MSSILTVHLTTANLQLGSSISMNLNIPNGPGADAQCAYNRSGILCGTCQENLSLSLDSSHCLPCHSH